MTMQGFPEDLSNVFKALADETNQAILLVLVARKEMTYTDLLDYFEAELLDIHLKQLRYSGLVDSIFNSFSILREDSIYRVTPFFNRIMDGMTNAFNGGVRQ